MFYSPHLRHLQCIEGTVMPYVPTKYIRSKFWDSNTYTMMSMGRKSHKNTSTLSRLHTKEYHSPAPKCPCPSPDLHWNSGMVFPVSRKTRSGCTHSKARTEAPGAGESRCFPMIHAKGGPGLEEQRTQDPKMRYGILKVCNSCLGLTSNEVFQEEDETVGMSTNSAGPERLHTV